MSLLHFLRQITQIKHYWQSFVQQIQRPCWLHLHNNGCHRR